MSKGDDDDSELVSILHQCDKHTVVSDEKGTVRLLCTVNEGTPVPPGSRVVGFEDHDESGYVWMKTLYRTPGPSKVNSRKYKSGWDSVFGKQVTPRGMN